MGGMRVSSRPALPSIDNSCVGADPSTKLRPAPYELSYRRITFSVGVGAVRSTGFAPPGRALRDEGENFEKRNAMIATESLKIAGQSLNAFVDRFIIENWRGTEHDGRRR